MPTNITRRSLFVAAAASATWLGLMPRTALADPTSTGLQAQLDEARSQLDTMGSNLASMQSDLATAEETLENTKTQIMDTQSRIEETQTQLDDKRTELSNSMRSSYKSGSTSMLDFVLGATSAEDLVSRIYYMDKVSDSQASAIESVKELGDQLAQQESQLENKQAEQEQNLATTQASVSDYETAVAQAQSYYNGLDSQVQQALAQEAAAAKVAVAQTSTGATTTTTATTNAGVSTVVDAVETSKDASNAASSVSDSESGSYDASSSSSIVANAEQFIGWPYKWGCYGTDMGGFDCCGLVATAYHLAGYSTPYATNVPGLMSWVKKRGNWKDCDLSNYASVLSAGDIIFCSTGHVAIYAGGNQMIHAPVKNSYVCQARVYACIGGGFGG